MDAGPAPPPSYNAAPEIPTEIFQPLLSIAQRGYDANDIKNWYLTMVRHLRRMGTENADAAYTLITPVSDKKAPIFSDDDSSSTNAPVESYEDHVSPGTVPTGFSWSRSASYEPSIREHIDVPANASAQQIYNPPPEQPQQMQIHIPSSAPPQQLYESSNDRPQSVLLMSANYSPSRSTHPQLDANEILATNAEPVTFATERATSNQWFSPDDFRGGNHQQPQYGQPWGPAPAPYQVAMSNTAMPLLVPFHPPPQQQQPQPEPCYTEDLFAPFSSGLGLSQLANELYTSPFFPTIDIVPSRKRRKVLRSGVKRIAQTLQNSRQSI